MKYDGKQHVENLMTVLREHCKISHNRKGKGYLGLDLDLNYETAKCTY